MTPDPSVPDPARELRVLLESGRFREVLDAHQARGEAEARGRPEVQLLAATAATRLGEFTEAISLAEAALQQFQARGDRDGRLRSTNLLGAIAWELGRLDEAERRFGEALEQARVLDDTLMMAHASNNLASVAHLRDRPELALSLYRTALLDYQRLGDRRGTAQTCHNLSLVFRMMSNWEDAERAGLEAVRHADLLGEGSLLALTVAGRAELHIDQGQVDLAATELVRSAALAHQAEDGVGVADVTRLEARLAIQAGRLDEGLERARAGAALAEELGAAQLGAECLALEALALHRLGRGAEAERARAEATARFERLGATGLIARLAEEWSGPTH